MGFTGIGKSWLACAWAQKACREGFRPLDKKTSELFRELAVAQADGTMGRETLRLAQIDVLLLDDFATAPLEESASAANSSRSGTIASDTARRFLTSQMPVAHWHEQIGYDLVADSILDLLQNQAIRIHKMLKRESIRIEGWVASSTRRMANECRNSFPS